MEDSPGDTWGYKSTSAGTGTRCIFRVSSQCELYAAVR
jgi:hypothetical protein